MNHKICSTLFKTTLLTSFLVSGSFAKDRLSSYFIGIGNSENNTISDTSLNAGFNINILKFDNLKIEFETSLSMSNNDNNFLDLLPEISYKTNFGTISIIGGFTAGYMDLNKENVYGTTIGGKYTTIFKNHNLQFSYKSSSLENSIAKIDDIDRFSVNYIYEY